MLYNLNLTLKLFPHTCLRTVPVSYSTVPFVSSGKEVYTKSTRFLAKQLNTNIFEFDPNLKRAALNIRMKSPNKNKIRLTKEYPF